MFTVRKMFKWEGAHLLSAAYSKDCLNVHGHSYKAEIIIHSNQLNKDGMVIDFKLLKEIVSPVIGKMDHALMYHNSTPQEFQGIKVIQTEYNPTAENMCKHIYEAIVMPISLNCSLERLTVRVHETDTGYAEYNGIYL